MPEKLQKQETAQVPETNWQRFSVQFEYPVCFTDDLFSIANKVLLQTITRLEPNKRHRIIVFIDDGLLKVFPDLNNAITSYVNHYPHRIELVTAPVALPAGETLKSSLRTVKEIQHTIADHHLDRHSYIIAIGGGALLDAVGFIAATSHRGIRHIRVPTTVLAQNDSGVGVKNSVNLHGQKNYLGTFAPPFAVLNDYRFITRLPDRDKIAGMAEAVKVALIRDCEFYQWLEQQSTELAEFDNTAMRYMIKRCAELHMQQIANGGDPFETGSARPLDFGHWVAHKLETMTDYRLRHGEAVAIGLALDTRYSVLCGLLPEGDELRVTGLLQRLGFQLWHPGLELKNVAGELEILRGLREFREHLGGELTITLLEKLGQGIEVHAMDYQMVERSIRWLKQRYD